MLWEKHRRVSLSDNGKDETAEITWLGWCFVLNLHGEGGSRKVVFVRRLTFGWGLSQ